MRNFVQRLLGIGRAHAFDAAGSGWRWESAKTVKSQVEKPAAGKKKIVDGSVLSALAKPKPGAATAGSKK